MSLIDEQIDVLALPGWRLHPDGDSTRFTQKHVGVACRMRWSELCGYLSRGVAGDPTRDPEIAKRQEGGWTGGLYRGDWRHHSAFIHTQLLTIDVDAHGEVQRAAAALAPFRVAIHSTFKSRPDAPRCRAVILLSEPCADLRAYKVAHKAIRERLYSWGYVRPDKARGIKGDIDEGASDATRLSYAPMYCPPREFAFATTAGEPLDIARIPAPPAPVPRSHSPRERNLDAYREGALRRAEEEVRTSLEGQRHEVLFREAASLARPDLGLSEVEIEGALLPAFIAAAGEHRLREGERTIVDAMTRGRCGL